MRAMRIHKSCGSIQSSASCALLHIVAHNVHSQGLVAVKLRQQLVTILLDNLPAHVTNRSVMKDLTNAQCGSTLGHSCEWPFYQALLEKSDTFKPLAELLSPAHSFMRCLHTRSAWPTVWSGVRLHARNQYRACETGLMDAMLQTASRPVGNDVLFRVRTALTQ